MSDFNPWSRREFLGAAGAVAGSAFFSPALGLAQSSADAAPRYIRANINSPKGRKDLASYKKAVEAMLAYPADDPRNWYRNALIHTVDCPHGNWWFLVWHRGYLYWFEKICRELSGDPEFAIPYWDWTAEPSVPLAMYDGVLTPTDPKYIASYNDFYSQYKSIVAGQSWWQGAQFGQLRSRSVRFPDDLWYDVENNPMFVDRAQARSLDRNHRALDACTQNATSLPVLNEALAIKDFMAFGSTITLSHQVTAGFGILEGLPHNRVHNSIGGVYLPNGQRDPNPKLGFMQDNLSPVDPVFFLHHSNIDRIWDLWTRKQLRLGLPILPQGYKLDPKDPAYKTSDYYRWINEPFLFFYNDQQQPLLNGKAGDYVYADKLGYGYDGLGSGESVVPKGLTAAVRAVAPKAAVFAGKLDQAYISDEHGVEATIALAPGTLTKLAPRALTATAAGEKHLYARIEVAYTAAGHGKTLSVLVNAPSGESAAEHSPEHFAACLSMFGHHNVLCPVTYTVPLSAVLQQQAASNQPLTDQLKIRVVSEEKHGMLMKMAGENASEAGPSAEILSVSVESY